jgi:hypothetical protein
MPSPHSSGRSRHGKRRRLPKNGAASVLSSDRAATPGARTRTRPSQPSGRSAMQRKRGRTSLVPGKGPPVSPYREAGSGPAHLETRDVSCGESRGLPSLVPRRATYGRRSKSRAVREGRPRPGRWPHPGGRVRYSIMSRGPRGQALAVGRIPSLPLPGRALAAGMTLGTRSSGCPMTHEHGAGAEERRLYQSELRHAGRVDEQPLATAEDDREDELPILIDTPRRDQAADARDASGDIELLPGASSGARTSSSSRPA